MEKVEIIAEIGSVHDGSFGNALKLIELSKECGADTVKFQTHIASAETLRDAPMPSYFRGEPRFEYFERTGFTTEQWKYLKSHCDEVGIGFLSSPFSLEAIDLLEEVGVDTYKVPSGEVTNLPLLEKLAKTGKRILLSSGMSDWRELDQAHAVLSALGSKVCVMQCSSQYPCDVSQVGLNVMTEMAVRYGDEIGFSDHTHSNVAAICAVYAGATVIEKHLTFSKKMYGSDAANAAEPEQFKALCSSIREAEKLRHCPVNKDDVSRYREMKTIFEKSIVAARKIPSGHMLTLQDLAFKKPGNGIAAARYHEIVGRKTKIDLDTDQMVLEDHLVS